MTCSPCCMALQRGVRIMAMIDIVFDVINIIVAILAIVGVVNDDFTFDFDQTNKDVAIGVLVLYLIIAILGLLMSIRLLNGANNRDVRNCTIWLVVSCIILSLNILSAILNGTAGKPDTANLTTTLISLVYRLYMMLVVFCFIKELKSETQIMGFQARLEGGIGYSMQSFPQPNPPQQNVVYPGQAPPYQAVVISGIPPQQPQTHGNGMYNQNNQYYSTGNI